MNTYPIEIELSKKKIIIIIAGCIAFVAAGIYFITHPDFIALEFLTIPINNIYLGYTAAIAFALFAVIAMRLMLSDKKGLTIDEGGITDNSSFTAVGFINWRDVEEITTTNIKGQEIILIKVINPDEYINNMPSGMKRNIMRLNVTSTGTPIALSATGLKCSSTELLSMLQEGLQKFGKK